MPLRVVVVVVSLLGTILCGTPWRARLMIWASRPSRKRYSCAKSFGAGLLTYRSILGALGGTRGLIPPSSPLLHGGGLGLALAFLVRLRTGLRLVSVPTLLLQPWLQGPGITPLAAPLSLALVPRLRSWWALWLSIARTGLASMLGMPLEGWGSIFRMLLLKGISFFLVLVVLFVFSSSPLFSFLLCFLLLFVFLFSISFVSFSFLFFSCSLSCVFVICWFLFPCCFLLSPFLLFVLFVVSFILVVLIKFPFRLFGLKTPPLLKLLIN